MSIDVKKLFSQPESESLEAVLERNRRHLQNRAQVRKDFVGQNPGPRGLSSPLQPKDQK